MSLLDPISTFGPLPLPLVLRTLPTLAPVVKRWALPRFLAWVDGQGVDPQADPMPDGDHRVAHRH